MSLPVMQYWVSFAGRRNRKSFMIAFAIILLGSIVLGGIVGGILGSLLDSRTNFVLIVSIILLPLRVCSYIVIAQRIRDLNMSGWFALVIAGLDAIVNFLPPTAAAIFFALGFAAFIALCALPGTKGPNNYGDDPLELYPPTTL